MTEQAITQTVRSLYEAFPYPNYPMLAKPRWQEGYAANPQFAQALLASIPRGSKHPAAFFMQKQVLIGGSGEILPYVIRRWRTQGSGLACLDLSLRSLNRARWRLNWRGLGVQFIQADLAQYLSAPTQDSMRFDHMDFYGVLHHVANPSQVLKLAAARLAHHGSMRLMVYNSKARHWIHALQHTLQLLAFNMHRPGDIAAARNFLREAAQYLPRLAEKLAQIGDTTLRNEARFVDTFMHTREARLSFTHWFQAFAKAGLHAYGLFDRYAELDDLANPLWQLPDLAALEARADDLRYENNLELFLCKNSQVEATKQQAPVHIPTPRTRQNRPSLRHLLNFRIPYFWLGFNETRHLTSPQVLQLWRDHLAYVANGETSRRPNWLKWSIPSLQRLARIGAILPGMIPDRSLQQTLLAPMVDKMELPQLPAKAEQAPEALIQLLAKTVAHRLPITSAERQAKYQKLIEQRLLLI